MTFKYDTSHFHDNTDYESDHEPKFYLAVHMNIAEAVNDHTSASEMLF